MAGRRNPVLRTVFMMTVAVCLCDERKGKGECRSGGLGDGEARYDDAVKMVGPRLADPRSRFVGDGMEL